MRVLIAGCGWLGVALGLRLAGRGDHVVGIRRDPAAGARLAACGIEPLILDLAAPGALKRLPADADAVVACQAADSSAELSYRRAYLEALEPLVEFAGLVPSRRLVFTGSTSVFGQADGGDVDELTPIAPAGANGRILGLAEARLAQARAHGVAGWVVRLSGLYGPGRFGVIDRVRRGRLALGPGDSRWMNFCHLEDAVRTLIAVLDRGRAGATYHASDAEPMRVREVVRWICGGLGIDPPDSGADAGSRRADRRVLALRSRDELGLTPAYPSIREGLVEAPCWND